MATNANKLVDKYQYNEAQIKMDGMAELITARHIISKEIFTLKKISVKDSQAAPKYYALMNEMNVLKTLGSRPFLFKCHKMLKTSNNVYIVYDLMGQNSTLGDLIEKRQLNSHTRSKLFVMKKEKRISLQILRALKNLKQNHILFLDVNSNLIVVEEGDNIKFRNLQNAISLDRNASPLSFLNIRLSNDLAPELKDFIQNYAYLSEKQIECNLLIQKIAKVELFSFGKILNQLYKQEFTSLQNQNAKYVGQTQSFESQLKNLAQRLTSQNPNERPSYHELQQLFIKNKQDRIKNLGQRQRQRQDKVTIKISRLQNRRKHSPKDQKSNNKIKSRSAIKYSRTNQKQSSHLLTLPTGDESFDNKSVRSLGSYIDTSNILKSSRTQKSRSYKNQSEVSDHNDSFKDFVLKVLKRRSLCKFIMNLSEMILKMTVIEQSQRVMLSFLLLKKSVLLICSLAQFIQTGKGDNQQLIVNDSVRKQFSQTDDFSVLSAQIDLQMDTARKVYFKTIESLNNEYEQLKQNKQLNFVYQCKSENLNENIMKQLIKASIEQILKKIETPKKSVPQKKPSRNFLKPQDNFINMKIVKKRSEKDESFSMISTRSLRVSRQDQAHLSASASQNYQSEYILRNISAENLINVYMMGLVLNFETFEKMFHKQIKKEKIQLEQQLLIQQLRKMQPKKIAIKIHEIIS